MIFIFLNDGTIKFGEITFTSLSGICEWYPPNQEKVFGALLITIKKVISCVCLTTKNTKNLFQTNIILLIIEKLKFL